MLEQQKQNFLRQYFLGETLCHVISFTFWYPQRTFEQLEKTFLKIERLKCYEKLPDCGARWVLLLFRTIQIMKMTKFEIVLSIKGGQTLHLDQYWGFSKPKLIIQYLENVRIVLKWLFIASRLICLTPFDHYNWLFCSDTPPPPPQYWVPVVWSYRTYSREYKWPGHRWWKMTVKN